ncbi:MAG: three-Cys-motif partner protein TcmP, partial [SAR202 cluster bacterium]|nr:three-Cys-motif partner protein TcmP [SAR202 cluster bacterium]
MTGGRYYFFTSGLGAGFVRDSDPQKWIYKEHTRVKHELLDKYLYGWLWILGTRHPRLLIVDGFAGRGEYEDGSKGSPLIILEKAARLVEQKRVDEVWCVFVERNQENIENLNKVLKAQWADHEGVRVFGPYGEPFEDVAKKVITKLGAGMPPSFWFVDPFGFTGISFEILSTIMSLRRSELFVNLMLRDIHRFLEHPELSSSFDRLFGSPDWRELTGPSGAREGQILELRDFYARRMRSIGCKVTVFRVASDKNSHTLYCLVHATKSCAGRWLMKDIMNSQGTQGVFEYLGP